MPSMAATYTFTGEAVEIPTSGPADPSFIYVEGVEGVVTNVSLSFNGLTHKFAKETMVALSNPDGWASLIWDGVKCKYNGIDVVFTDLAEESLEDRCGSGGSLESGTYSSGLSDDDHAFTIPIAPIRPLFPTLNELILPNPNGRWILWAEDFISGDGGTIGSWEIIIETED